MHPGEDRDHTCKVWRELDNARRSYDQLLVHSTAGSRSINKHKQVCSGAECHSLYLKFQANLTKHEGLIMTWCSMARDWELRLPRACCNMTWHVCHCWNYQCAFHMGTKCSLTRSGVSEMAMSICYYVATDILKQFGWTIWDRQLLECTVINPKWWHVATPPLDLHSVHNLWSA